MVVEKDLLALSDVAKLCNTSNSNISNWRNRDEKFPKPFATTSAGPIWKSEDIIGYLQQKAGTEYDVITSGNLSSTKVAIIGRERGGKSFLTSRFVLDKKGFVDLFCGNDKAKTPCPVFVKVSEYISLDGFMFHSDFNSIYQDDDDEIKALKAKVSALVDNMYLQSDLEKMAEIEDLIRDIKKVEENYPNRRKAQLYIDAFERPSNFCKELLRECNLGNIEIVDTPGVSGKVEASKVDKCSIYLFLIKPDNEDESQTLCRLVTQLKSEIATSKVAFLYKKEGMFFTEKKYNDAKESVKKNMAVYTDLFEDLKGSIISTELDVLDPASHCIMFPTMDPEDETLPEELFLKDIKNKLVTAFVPQSGEEEDAVIAEIIKSYGKEAVDFTISLLNGIPMHSLTTDDKKYSDDDVISEKHDRVMTNDSYRFRTDLSDAYHKEADLLYDYFSKFEAVDYPEEWKQITIKYVYKKLIASVKTDRGLGVGTHPWEEKPARTMLIEESIFADRILASIQGKEAVAINEPYRKALRNCNITSATWNFVGCKDDAEAVLKLEIITKCLLAVPVSDRKSMVLNRYVGGLRKVAEYKILDLLGFSHDEAMKQLQQLPF